MRRWSTGTNDYYFTAGIFLKEAPWYVFMIESIVMNICHLIPRIPLPKSIKVIREGEEYTLRDWYGTTADLFHIYVCAPISGWCSKKTKTHDIEFPYKMLKNLIPESVDDENDMVDRDLEEMYILAENKRYADLLGEEFNEAYQKLKNIYVVRSKKIQEGDKNENKDGLCDE